MFDWIKSLFGRGKVRAEWEGIDKYGNVKSGDAKAPYIGSYDETAMKDFISRQLLFEYGITATKIDIIAHIEGG